MRRPPEDAVHLDIAEPDSESGSDWDPEGQSDQDEDPLQASRPPSIPSWLAHYEDDQ